MRYFIELSYHGSGYAGFQVQQNAVTIQSEVEKALATVLRQHFVLTGSSRTDAGVHARQNYFHFDADITITSRHAYNINAVLPKSIAIKRIAAMAKTEAHCRFDAKERRYRYYLYQQKNPFLNDRAWFYPYTLQIDAMQQCAAIILNNKDFTSFSKRNTQVKTMICSLTQSRWHHQDELLVYEVAGNRFLRGMVRGLVSTMLLAGRGKLSAADLLQILEAKDCTLADFSAPAHGLFLEEVVFEKDYFG